MVGPTEDEVFNTLKDLSPNQLLIKSCEIGLLKGVKNALDRGVNIHINNDEALKISSQKGYTEIVKLLLDKGANIYDGNNYALRYDKQGGHTDTVELLKDYMSK